MFVGSFGGNGGKDMARKVERLTALKVEKAKRPGMYADGAGLYLQVTSEGAKSWIYRFSLNRPVRWAWVRYPRSGWQTPARRPKSAGGFARAEQTLLMREGATVRNVN